jgi:S-adenosylmethionine decarboxylase
MAAGKAGQTIQEAFGLHLTIDAYQANPAALGDLDLIYKFLDRLPDIISMTKIMPPYVFRYKGVRPEECGISGFVLIAESHCSIHTWPEKGFFSLDIFSCLPFDPALPIGFARDNFGFQKVEKRLFNRGLEFPPNAGLVTEFLKGERGQMEGGRG